MSRELHDAIVEARELRKKLSRIEKSRGAIKMKNREKGKAIKAHQDREEELKENRDEWKIKYKEQEKEAEKLRSDFKDLARKLQMTEEELQQIRDEFNEVKKKYPEPISDACKGTK